MTHELLRTARFSYLISVRISQLQIRHADRESLE